MRFKVFLFICTLFTFAFGVTVGMNMPQAHAQQVDINPAQSLITPSDPAAPPLPDVSLTLADVIDILSDYSLEHEKSTFFGGTFYGVTDYENRTIHIASKYDLADRRDTVLHEFVHVMYRLKGFKSTSAEQEVVVEKQASRMYRELYGIPVHLEGKEPITGFLKVVPACGGEQ